MRTFEIAFNEKELELIVKAIEYRQSEWFNEKEDYNLIQIKIGIENELHN